MSRPSDGSGCGGPRPKLVFHVSHFLRGGIESTLVEWIRLLAPHYEITLSVLLRTEEFEFYRGRLPAAVRVRFLLTEP